MRAALSLYRHGCTLSKFIASDIRISEAIYVFGTPYIWGTYHSSWVLTSFNIYEIIKNLSSTSAIPISTKRDMSYKGLSVVSSIAINNYLGAPLNGFNAALSCIWEGLALMYSFKNPILITREEWQKIALAGALKAATLSIYLKPYTNLSLTGILGYLPDFRGISDIPSPTVEMAKSLITTVLSWYTLIPAAMVGIKIYNVLSLSQLRPYYEGQTTAGNKIVIKLAAKACLPMLMGVIPIAYTYNNPQILWDPFESKDNSFIEAHPHLAVSSTILMLTAIYYSLAPLVSSCIGKGKLDGMDTLKSQYLPQYVKGKTILDAFNGKVGKLLNLEYSELKAFHFIKDIETKTGKPLTTYELGKIKLDLEKAFQYRRTLWNIQEKEKTVLMGSEDEAALKQRVKQCTSDIFKHCFEVIANSLEFDRNSTDKAVLMASAIYSLTILDQRQDSNTRYKQASNRISSNSLVAAPMDNGFEKPIDIFKYVAECYVTKEENIQDKIQTKLSAMGIVGTEADVIIKGYNRVGQKETSVRAR